MSKVSKRNIFFSQKKKKNNHRIFGTQASSFENKTHESFSFKILFLQNKFSLSKNVFNTNSPSTIKIMGTSVQIFSKGKTHEISQKLFPNSLFFKITLFFLQKNIFKIKIFSSKNIFLK